MILTNNHHTMSRILTMLALITVLSITSANSHAQNKYTREQILEMSTEQLNNLPLEDLMAAVETLGVSSVDDLFALIMNKNVSSASKEEEQSFTSPLSTTVITKDEMRTYGILSIEEAFRLIPGMIVTEKTPGIYDVQMRGLNNIPDNQMLLYTENANTLLMIDGRPVQNYAIAALTLEALPISIEDVDRIEVVRGACGALYGANAVTGVINIITDKPNSGSPVVSGSFQMGNNDIRIGDFALRRASTSGKFAAGLTVNMQHRGRTTDLIPSVPTNDDRYYVVDDKILDETRFIFDPAGTTLKQKMDTWIANGQIREAKGEEMLTPDEMERFRTYKGQFLINTTEPATKISNQFDDLNTSRKNFGINGYITIKPINDVNIDVTGGYYQSSGLVGDLVEDVYPYATRKVKKGYANVSASIYDLQINVGYNGGSFDFVYGSPGYKVFENAINANAEYTFRINNLAIKPGVSYEWMKDENYQPVYNDPTHNLANNHNNIYEAYSWHYEKYGTEPPTYGHRLWGYFNKETHMSTFAPSLRLDYKIGDVRLIGAFRSDKTSMPDKWNNSWQFAASYNINNANFIRLVYGRANRSACLTNSDSDNEWQRTNMVPSVIVFEGNKDADLVHIDNIELGYRWRPTSKVLVDAEAFYSISKDFGSLMSNKSMYDISTEDLIDALVLADQFHDILTSAEIAGGIVFPRMESRSLIKYDNLPFTVKQTGVSVNIDYIISSKLITKLNFNWQKTEIDNYFRYNRNEAVASQLTGALEELKKTLLNPAIFGNYYPIVKQHQAEGMTLREAILEFLNNSEYTPQMNEYLVDNVYYLGSSNYQQPKTTNGHEHKATPSIYGMLGLIYKPVQQLNISAFANFIGKRTYVTSYSEEELDNRFTVNLKIGYKPVNNAEVFFNAHNLFDNEKHEFAYSDKIGGTYTVGVTFSF